MGARWYDPAIVMWTQPDSLVRKIRWITLALDRYSFVKGNPLRYRDPAGTARCVSLRSRRHQSGSPEVVAGAFLVAGALTVAIDQHQEEIAAAANSLGQHAADPSSRLGRSSTRPFVGEWQAKRSVGWG